MYFILKSFKINKILNYFCTKCFRMGFTVSGWTIILHSKAPRCQKCHVFLKGNSEGCFLYFNSLFCSSFPLFCSKEYHFCLPYSFSLLSLFLHTFYMFNLEVIFSIFVYAFLAVEWAECCGGRAAAEVVQPGRKLHDGAVRLHRRRSAAVPCLPHPQLGANRTSLWRVCGSHSFPKSIFGVCSSAKNAFKFR